MVCHFLRFSKVERVATLQVPSGCAGLRAVCASKVSSHATLSIVSFPNVGHILCSPIGNGICPLMGTQLCARCTLIESWTNVLHHLVPVRTLFFSHRRAIRFSGQLKLGIEETKRHICFREAEAHDSLDEWSRDVHPIIRPAEIRMP